MQQTIRNLEKHITDLKSEIRGRDDTIGDKERRLAEQRRFATELEKNRFVLEHNIEDLRAQLSPKDAAIQDLRAQIEEMEEELNAVSRIQTDLELQVQDARAKMTSRYFFVNLRKKWHP